MPTTSSRNAFRLRAVECFQQQQYPADWHVNLIIDEHETDSLGTKLNRMIASSDADYFITWDDDDWHSPTRVQRQVEPLLQGYEVSGTSQIYYQDGKEGFLYSGKPEVWLGGLAFRREVWECTPFEDVSAGVDNHWLRKNISAATRYDVADPALFIATIHANNTCRKHTAGWRKVDIRMLQEMMNRE
jgi:hypothetical protein